MIPVRCFSCNKVIAHKFSLYKKLQENGNISNNEIFDVLKIKRYCCKRMFMGTINYQEKMLQYPTTFDFHKIINN